MKIAKMKNTAELKYNGTAKIKIDRENFIKYLLQQKTKYIVLSNTNGEPLNVHIDFED